MKSTTTTLSLLLGIFAATATAQLTEPVANVVEPLASDDGSAVLDQFPVPVEMAKRDGQSMAQRFTSSLTKRHYGTFT